MKDLILYIHGKGGSAAECEHYKPLFPDCEIFGLDYQTFTPWETSAEIRTIKETLDYYGICYPEKRYTPKERM